jgi:hypothetical protein
MPEYRLSLMVVNDLSDVDETRHKALVFRTGSEEPQRVATKSELAAIIAAHVTDALTGGRH